MFCQKVYLTQEDPKPSGSPSRKFGGNLKLLKRYLATKN